jgi:PAS domain S-box-containing protein
MSDGIRVLHVDDQPEFVDLVGTFLKREDGRFDVEGVTSASDGLDLLAAESFDCVVSDYDMPGTDGIEFLDRVREEYPDLPFVLFTGKGSEEVASDAISSGVTDYLQKQSGTDQYEILAHRITNAVEAARSATEARTRRHRLEQVLKTVPGCVVQLDTDGQFVYANRRAKEVLGLEQSEVTDRTYNDPEWDIQDLDGDSIPDEELPFRRVVDSGEPVLGIRHSIRWPDGTRKVLLVNGAPLFENGEIGRVVFSLTDVTDRYERRRELRETERRLGLALEATETGIWEWDIETDRVRWNDTLERALGLDPGEFGGTLRAFFDRVHSEDRERVRAAVDRALATGEPYESEFRMFHEDGSIQWVSVRGRVVDSAGDRRMVGVHQDVTARRELKSELAATGEQYRTLVENLPDSAVYLYDESLRCVLAGGDALSKVGLSPGDVEGERPGDRYPSGLADEIETHLRAAFEGERGYFDQCLGGHHYQIRTIPVERGDGKIDRVMALSTEITDRRERERKLTALHDVAVDLESLDSVEAVCERTIEASEEILAFDLSVIDLEWDGTLSKAAVSGDIPESNTTEMSVHEGIAGKTYRTGESFLIDYLDERDEAKPQGPYESAISVPIRSHGVFQAVSRERGAFDAADLELAELLVSHTESALSRIDRQERLERQNERLSEFASMLSHDLRNPLHVAEARLELALEGTEDPDVAAAGDAVDRSISLVDQILALAREGDRAREVAPLDLAVICREAWDAVETGAATLHLETDRRLVADPSQLKRVLENLFANAVEHAGDAVAVTVGDTNDGFYVADDGRGIPEPDPATLFDAGYSTTDSGTGYGLYIVSEVADDHGWTVEVTDSEAGGARFEIGDVETERSV